jgi:hypothetical protein
MSTLKNYSRKLAQLSLHFGKLPQHISDKEVKKYLAELARKSKTPSLSDFKFSLRYCYRLLGITDKGAGVVCQTQAAQGNPASAAGLAGYIPATAGNHSKQARCRTKTRHLPALQNRDHDTPCRIAQGPRPSGIYQTTVKMLSRMNTNPQNRPEKDMALYCLYPSENNFFLFITRTGKRKTRELLCAKQRIVLTH